MCTYMGYVSFNGMWRCAKEGLRPAHVLRSRRLHRCKEASDKLFLRVQGTVGA